MYIIVCSCSPRHGCVLCVKNVLVVDYLMCRSRCEMRPLGSTRQIYSTRGEVLMNKSINSTEGEDKDIVNQLHWNP